MEQVGETKPEPGFFRNAAAICGGATASVGVLGLLGWISGLRVLASIDPNYIPMAPDTAVIFVVLGLILLVITHSPLPSRDRALFAIVVALASVYGLLKFIEYFGKLDLTFENILFPITENLGSFPIRRMSPISGALVLLSGAALLLTLWNKASELTRNLVGGLGILVLIAGFVATTGYLFGTPLLYGGDFIPLAATTAVAFLLLGIGLVAAAGPANVFVRPLVGSSVRARMLRAFLPLTAIIVLAQGFLREIIANTFEINHALLSAAFSLIFMAITAAAVTRVAQVISRAIDRHEVERKRAEEALQEAGHALRESEQDYRRLFETMLQGVVYQDAKGTIISMNPAAERILGKTKAEFLGQSSVSVEHDTLREDGSPFPGTEHPSMVALRTGRQVRDVSMRVYNPKEQQYRWINITAVPLFRQGEEAPYQVYTVFDDINERKRAEEALAYQARLLENVNDAIVASDAEYRLTTWNAAAERIYGWKAEEVLGRIGLEIVQTQFPEAERAEMLRAIGETGYYRGEATQARKDGSRFPVDVSSIVLREETGRITGYVSVNRDITERKRAEQALGSLAAIVESSDDAIYSKALDGIVTTWNGAAEKIYGYSRGEIIGRPIAIIVPPDRAEELVQIMEKIRHRERVQHFETVRVRKNGTPIDVAVTISPIEAANGKIIGASTIARDITERKRAEEALRRAEEKYRAIVDYAVEGIFQSTPEGRFITVNPALAHMWGYASPQELISSVTDIAQQVYVDPSRRAEFRRLMEEQGKVQGFEFQVRRKDGSVIWVSENARAVRDANGALLYYEGIVEDITARKQAEMKLQYLSTHDVLTGLYNRIFFEEELARLERSRHFPVSVVMADLNGLKQINDSEGHAAGDELLRQAAQVLKTAFRAEDVVARIGGDEFAVLLPNADAAAADIALARVRKSLTAENAQRRELPLSFALGTATANGPSSLAAVLKEADKRMYEDKSAQLRSENGSDL